MSRQALSLQMSPGSPLVGVSAVPAADVLLTLNETVADTVYVTYSGNSVQDNIKLWQNIMLRLCIDVIWGDAARAVRNDTAYPQVCQTVAV
jgi:hypothetical protein